MNKLEELKMQIYLMLIALAAINIAGAIARVVLNILEILPIPVLIIAFCYLLYKILRKEIY